MSERAYVDHLNDSYFAGRLSSRVVDRLAGLPVDRPDVRAFVERMFRMMTRSGFDAADVSTFHGDVLGSLLARLLPQTWDGRVPPVTVGGRHRRIDELVRLVMDPTGRGGKSFLDVACGFPPLTTVETADAFPGWQIVGLDRALPAYLVHDAQANYAVFDEAGRAAYFQPLTASGDAWLALMQDWQGTRTRFESLLQSLLLERARAGSTADRFEHNGAVLESDPVGAYERPNLRFVRGDLGSAAVEPADVVRCFNMLYYFDEAFRTAALRSFEAIVREDGLLVYGGNWAHSTECRYFTYRKRDGRLQASEFAFSLDNLSPLGIIPWYTLHDDNREVHLLAELTGVLRSDPGFRSELLSVADGLRDEYGMCPRGADGYYGEIASTVPPSEIWKRAGQIADRLSAHDLVESAVEVLTAAGWMARINEVGHVAVAVSE